MRDPLEGLDPDGKIRTSADRGRVPAAFEPVLRDVVAEFARTRTRTRSPTAELHLYGSVATGMARAGESDVDLVVIDGAAGWAEEVGARLTRRYSRLCRGVEIASVRASDHIGPDDESYGNRVFLRHYCVSLAGPDAARSQTPFAGDARAARGFNGDIARRLARWRADGARAPQVARKTLVAAAGIVSVRNRTWTTDRATAVRRWDEPVDAKRLAGLLGWAEGTSTADADDLAAALAPGGIVAVVADRFAAEIGLWS